MGQLIQSKEHVQQAQKPVEEIGPPPAQTSGEQDNGQTPPTTAMETATTHTHVSAGQVATPTDQTTQSTPADQDMFATDGDTAHACQSTTKKIMAVDTNEQHKPSRNNTRCSGQRDTNQDRPGGRCSTNGQPTKGTKISR